MSVKKFVMSTHTKSFVFVLLGLMAAWDFYFVYKAQEFTVVSSVAVEFPKYAVVDEEENLFVTWDEYGGEETWTSLNKSDVNGKVLFNKRLPNGSGAIALDSNENIYVVNSSKNMILSYDSKGKFLRRWGKEGVRNGQFARPCAIAVDSEDNIFVMDGKTNRVQVFNTKGKFLRDWVKGNDIKWGSSSFTETQIAIDSNDDVYINDQEEEIRKYDASGERISEWKLKFPPYLYQAWSGTALGKLFRLPLRGFIGPNDQLYVSYEYSTVIHVFDPDGNYLRAIVEPARVNIVDRFKEPDKQVNLLAASSNESLYFAYENSSFGSDVNYDKVLIYGHTSLKEKFPGLNLVIWISVAGFSYYWYKKIIKPSP